MSYQAVLSGGMVGSVEAYVAGTNRAQFFKRPMVPLLQAQPPEVVMQPLDRDHIVDEGRIIDEPLTKTVEVQTVFRESETQTDPYTVDYIEPPAGEEPEIFTLYEVLSLSYGRGLPASMTEMQAIQEMRQRRGFEDALPPTSDEFSFTLRRKLMEEQEIRQWNRREADIKKHQSERLNLLQSALLEREKETEEKHAQRTEEIRLKKTEQKDRTVAKIHKQRIKLLRKLYKERKALDTEKYKRDIVEEYANFGSSVYAPITREGLSLDKKANKFEVHPEALTTYGGLADLSSKLGLKITETRANVDKIEERFQSKYGREQRKHKDALRACETAIEEEKGPKTKEISRTDKGKDSDQVRCDTPDYDYHIKQTIQTPKKITWREQMEYNNAILLLQRLMKGRAIQNMMFTGKERRLDLIAELRATEEWKLTAQDHQENLILEAYQEKIMEGATEALQGTLIAGTIDQLSKELLRLKQERKIAAMVKLAERNRRTREAEESGRRQAEEILRQREDNLFKQFIGLHHTTLDSYLGSVIGGTINTAASLQALKEANVKAKKMNKMVDHMEDKLNKPQDLVRNLVTSFLIPDIQRSKLQKQVEYQQKRMMNSAANVAKDTIKESVSKMEHSKRLEAQPKK